MVDSSDARTSNAATQPPLCSFDEANRHRTSKAPPAAPIWSFERVRDTGEAEILRVSALQRDLVHRDQLLAAGISRGAIRRWLSVGRLYAVYRDVYLVMRRGVNQLTLALAAVMHHQGYALLSHRTAAVVWGMLDVSTDPPAEVTLIGRSAHPREGLVVHRVPTIDRQDIRRRQGLPVTSPARTLIDNAGVMSMLELENALAECRRQGLAPDKQIHDAIARVPANTAGIGNLRALMDGATPALTRSKAERKLIALLRSADLPLPVANQNVCGHMVDLLWPAHKLIVEFDGWETHGTRGAFETDRGRDQRLAAAGYVVIRVTWRQLLDESNTLIARIAAALAIRAPAIAS